MFKIIFEIFQKDEYLDFERITKYIENLKDMRTNKYDSNLNEVLFDLFNTIFYHYSTLCDNGLYYKFLSSMFVYNIDIVF